MRFEVKSDPNARSGPITDVYRNGPSDPVYQLYFGTGDSVVVLGAYENLMRSNKEGVILRCDDIDGSK